MNQQSDFQRRMIILMLESQLAVGGRGKCITNINLQPEVSEQCFDYRIRIRILFGFPKMTEYEYEYYSVSQKLPNTNTNIIRFPKNDRIRIRILFGFPKMTEYEYEYYSAFQKGPNTNTNIIQFSKNDRIRILFGFPKIHSGEKSNKCKQCEYAVLHAYHSSEHHTERNIFTNANNVILHF